MDFIGSPREVTQVKLSAISATRPGSLKSETMGKLINRILGECLLISSLPGSVLRTHVESLGKHRDFNMRSQAVPGKLDIKRHSLYMCKNR